MPRLRCGASPADTLSRTTHNDEVEIFGMKRPKNGRALFYTRDSGGQHEMTPGQYVAWGQRKANEFGVEFGGTPEAIESMIADGRSADGDLFLDYEVKGNLLSRKGLDALIKEALQSQ